MKNSNGTTKNLSLFPSASNRMEEEWVAVSCFIYLSYSFAHQLIKSHYIQLKTICCLTQNKTQQIVYNAFHVQCETRQKWDGKWIAFLWLDERNIGMEKNQFSKEIETMWKSAKQRVYSQWHRRTHTHTHKTSNEKKTNKENWNLSLFPSFGLLQWHEFLTPTTCNHNFVKYKTHSFLLKLYV